MSSVDLYYVPESAPCRSVLMAAKAFGVNLNLKVKNPMTGETRTEDFMKINIQHTIPTMDDNGFCLNESRAMLQYLANKYGKDGKLYPTDPQARAKVDMRLYFDMGTLYHRLAEAYYPSAFGGQPMSQDKLDKFGEALGYLEHYLADGYVAGSSLTIADHAVIATLSTATAFGYDVSKYPRTVAYMEKLKGEIEGFQELNQDGAEQFGSFVKSAIEKASA